MLRYSIINVSLGSTLGVPHFVELIRTQVKESFQFEATKELVPGRDNIGSVSG